jgi:UDP-N-acetylmuramyl pentapeptide phosphotransferase/UDP-N-acetylglucosamine-1-phosphate transferase
VSTWGIDTWGPGLGSVALGVVGGWLAYRACRPILDHTVFERQNYRGHALPTAGGLVILVALLAAAATAGVGYAYLGPTSAAEFVRSDAALRSLGAVALFTVVAMLGLLDDLTGAGQSYGFRGHFRALAAGTITSGALKAFGGPAAALGLAPFLGAGSFGQALLMGACIALWANVGNLFDRAPGRTTKAMLIVHVVAIATGVATAGAVVGDNAARWVVTPGGALPVLFVAGAAVAVLGPDLRERLMLGDTGSNLLGASAGLACVLWHSTVGWAVATAIAAALNLASEFVSFSKVIPRIPLVRELDSAGRLPVD